MCSEDDDCDIEDSDGKSIRSWDDADISWVTDELAERIKAAAAAAVAASEDQESFSPNDEHPVLSQTVQLDSFVATCIHRCCVVLLGAFVKKF